MKEAVTKMSVEFQLDHQDHKKVEDFLARTPAGVSAISLHPKAAKRQQAAAEIAAAQGIDVLYDPRSERLEHEGFTLDGLPGHTGRSYDLDKLAADSNGRSRLVDAVVDAHPDFATIITPPHFFTRDTRIAHLNLALAEMVALNTDRPVRPTLILRPKEGVVDADAIAQEYCDAGFDKIELRFSPLGGEDDGIPKIRAAFAIADTFQAAGLAVTLGRSGNVGQTAMALGHAHHYSVGIGQMEHVNHATDISRQKRPPVFDEEGKRKGGVWQGVYLPGLAATLSMRRARQLLEHTDIRTRLGCRTNECANSLLGPVDDYQAHYLHSRAGDAAKLEATPAPWRPKLETDRLRRAMELRHLVNHSYRADGQPELRTRTLKSLVDDIHEERAANVA